VRIGRSVPEGWETGVSEEESGTEVGVGTPIGVVQARIAKNKISNGRIFRNMLALYRRYIKRVNDTFEGV
jgi:hypothetical protein